MGLVVVNEYFAPAYLSALLNLLALIPLIWYAHTSRSFTRAVCRRYRGSSHLRDGGGEIANEAGDLSV